MGNASTGYRAGVDQPKQPPLGSPIQDLLDGLHSQLSALCDGAVATYIPELSTADPSWFGLALATLDGHVYASGDTDLPFTIQSVSKPFVYALALADRGLEEVLAHVGVEPSGERFDGPRLEQGTGRPLNPMVNTGAIVTGSLVDGGTAEARFARILHGLSEFAGRELDVDERVLASERTTADHNRALAYLMRAAGSLTCPVDDALAVYFRECSIRVTARDLAVMAATLASGGVNPVTGRTVVGIETVQHVLTVMATCGTYDFAGEWLLRTGLPAKSGVSGGLAAALPSQLGLGVFSPPLDQRGNSVRAIAACEQVSSRFGVHVMRPLSRFGPVFHRTTHGDMRHSRRSRPGPQRELLERSGHSIAIYELQGDLGFAGADTVLRVVGEERDLRWLVLDLLRLGRVQEIGVTLLEALVARLAERGVATVVVDRLQRSLLASAELDAPTLDEALEWCEDQLLAAAGRIESGVPLSGQDLLRDLPAAQLAALEGYLDRRELADGQRADAHDALCFVISGGLALRESDGRRVASMAPGTAVGRLALLDDLDGGRYLVAEGPTVCMALGMDALARLDRERPALLHSLRWAVARTLAERYRHSTARSVELRNDQAQSSQ